MRCPTCTGTGKIMGGGMIYKDCHICDGSGKLLALANIVAEDIKINIDKRSKKYRDIVYRMKCKYPNKDMNDIKKLIDEEIKEL